MRCGRYDSLEFEAGKQDLRFMLYVEAGRTGRAVGINQYAYG